MTKVLICKCKYPCPYKLTDGKHEFCHTEKAGTARCMHGRTEEIDLTGKTVYPMEESHDDKI
jgi:hypothetical protein